ncbi:ATP-dependent metalloprotease, partial [Escherichia coli]|nr:ATP-dependent metalloprotease [Escherichia coli]
IATAYAGRIAEELIYGRDKVTTGASSDIQFATNTARNMVTQWGFSDRLGPMQYSKEEGPAFLGRSSGNGSGISD